MEQDLLQQRNDLYDLLHEAAWLMSIDSVKRQNWLTKTSLLLDKVKQENDKAKEE